MARFVADTRANVAVIFALTLPVTLGVSGLVAEYGYSLSVQASNQRTADLAAYAGALAYSATTSTSSMNSAAKRVGELNGVLPANVAVSLVASPRSGSTSQAVRAVITVDNPIFLAPILGASNTVRITAFAYAEVGAAGVGACVVALDASKSGVTLSGGTSLTAPACAVSSNSKIEASCGTSVTAKRITYGTSLIEGCNNITGETEARTTTTDPFAGNAAVATARARFGTLSGQAAPAAPTAPAAPVVSGGFSIDFGYNDSSTQNQAIAAGCTASKSGSTWTLTCPQGTSGLPRAYTFANLTVGGGINLSFNPSGSGFTTYNFSGPLNPVSTTVFGPGIYNFGGAMGHTQYGSTTFGAGTYNFAQTFNASGSGTVVFGNGTYNFARGMATGGSTTTTFGSGPVRMGPNPTACGGATYSLCHLSSSQLTMPSTSFQLTNGLYNAQRIVLGTGTGNTYWFGKSSGGDSVYNNGGGNATFANGTFQFSGGVTTSGGNTLTLGAGTDNSYQIGASNNGDALNLGGGSMTYTFDATRFELGGNLSSLSGGGSCLIIGAATNHDIRGNFNAAGAVVMGAGVYTIDGFFALGSNNGGGNACPGYSNTVRGIGVTLVLSGKTTSPSGSCVGQTFCVSAGYSNVELASPTSGTYANFAVIGPATNTGGALFTQGGSGGRISGAFYFPVGPIALSGGAGVAGGTNCLQLIGSLITLSGGTTAASECIAAAGSGGGGRPRLVQ